MIHLGVAGRKPTEQEEQRGMDVAHRIAEFLTDKQTSLAGNFIGAVDELGTAKKELLIVLATSDADKLFEVIAPFLADLDWARPIQVEKICGSRFDKKAKRELISLRGQ